MKSKLIAIAGSVVLAMFLLAPQAHAASYPVAVVDNSFFPATITIQAGDTVTWINMGTMSHTVTADDNSFDSGTLMRGNTYSHTFNTPGTYRYYCRFHGGPGGSGMSAIIIVAGNQNNNSPGGSQYYNTPNPYYPGNTYIPPTTNYPNYPSNPNYNSYIPGCGMRRSMMMGTTYSNGMPYQYYNPTMYGNGGGYNYYDP